MEIEQTKLAGCFIIKPKVFKDSRGYFFESFNRRKYNQILGEELQFVQDNQVASNYGVVRGLHFQTGENAQAKLVQVVRGSVLDVVVDCRKGSPTFLQSFSIEINETNKYQLFVPRGFAHGYAVLEDQTIFAYKCDNYYEKASESGINLNDSQLNIDWKIPTDKMIISDKDRDLPFIDPVNKPS